MSVDKERRKLPREKADEILGIDGKWREHIDALQFHGAIERLDFLFATFPRIKGCTHESIAYVSCMQREVVTRALKKMRKKGLI